MNTISKIEAASTMPELDALRTEAAKDMMSGDQSLFHQVQDAFIKAKNRLQRIPVSKRNW